MSARLLPVATGLLVVALSGTGCTGGDTTLRTAPSPTPLTTTSPAPSAAPDAPPHRPAAAPQPVPAPAPEPEPEPGSGPPPAPEPGSTPSPAPVAPPGPPAERQSSGDVVVSRSCANGTCTECRNGSCATSQVAPGGLPTSEASSRITVVCRPDCRVDLGR